MPATVCPNWPLELKDTADDSRGDGPWQHTVGDTEREGDVSRMGGHGFDLCFSISPFLLLCECYLLAFYDGVGKVGGGNNDKDSSENQTMITTTTL